MPVKLVCGCRVLHEGSNAYIRAVFAYAACTDHLKRSDISFTYIVVLIAVVTIVVTTEEAEPLKQQQS